MSQQTNNIDNAEIENAVSQSELIEPLGTDLFCTRCHIPMQPSKALMQTYVGGIPDFPGKPETIVTMSAGGPGKLVDCLKCPECGKCVST